MQKVKDRVEREMADTCISSVVGSGLTSPALSYMDVFVCVGGVDKVYNLQGNPWWIQVLLNLGGFSIEQTAAK